MIKKLIKSLRNYTRIMRLLKAPKEEQRLIENLINAIQHNENLLVKIIEYEVERNKFEETKKRVGYINRDKEILEFLKLIRKDRHFLLNEDEERKVRLFLEKNLRISELLNLEDNQFYNISNENINEIYTNAELKFIYMYLLEEDGVPKYSNKMELIEDLKDRIYQKNYMKSFNTLSREEQDLNNILSTILKKKETPENREILSKHIKNFYKYNSNFTKEELYTWIENNGSLWELE